jgi:hypothetical protein
MHNLIKMLEAQNLVVCSNSNYVGLGWVIGTDTEDSIVPHEDGTRFGDQAHHQSSHQKMYERMVVRKHPDLKGTDYSSSPRYRVYYDTKNRQSYVIGWTGLLQLPKLRKHITDLYKLENPKFYTEDHYNVGNTGPDPMRVIQALRDWK